jgi:hypothetical protein
MDAPNNNRPTPLWAVNLFSFLNSMGTGLVTNGIFFITSSAYGFSSVANLWLGVALGVTYVGAALFAGPGVRAVRRRFPSLSTRAVLVALMAAMAVLASLPALAGLWEPVPGPIGIASVWVLVVCYSPLTGVLWPVVESFLSGGRREVELRSAVGMWNFTWSSALVLGALFLGSMVESYAAIALLAVALVHLGGCGVLTAFGREPGEHLDSGHHEHPAVYRKLLVTFRILLPVSYIVLSALSPLLPSVMRQLEVPVGWQPVLAAAWLLPRSLGFLMMERWQGWHGRWSHPVISGALVIVGFGIAVLSPQIASGGAGIAVLAGGLATFGLGQAMVYSAAIYYALEVGNAEVDAGGMHEALIGVGYTVGPLCGLAAVVGAPLVGVSTPETALFLLVGVIALGAAIGVGLRVRANTAR